MIGKQDESMTKVERFMGWTVVVIIAGHLLGGCAVFSGKGIEAYAGVRAMDERQVSEQTHPAVPLKCYFVSCAPEAKGS